MKAVERTKKSCIFATFQVGILEEEKTNKFSLKNMLL